MKIITIGNTKGGVGKSTITVNLAVCFSLKKNKILVIDTDPQKSSCFFVGLRQNEKNIKVLFIDTPTIHQEIKKIKGFDFVLIDSGGRDDSVFRSALITSDMVIVPTGSSVFDAWALDDLMKTIEKAKKINKFKVFLLHNFKKTGTIVDSLIEENFKNIGAEFLKSTLSSRVDFKNSMFKGKGVVELPKRNKARQEFESLYRELIKKL